MSDVGGAVLLHTIVADAYKRGLAAGIAQERERCARVAEDADWADSPGNIAAAIRAGEASE